MRQQLNQIRLSRDIIEQFLFLPKFDQIVINCFVRIKIDQNVVYQVAEIIGVVEIAEPYNFGKYRTNKGLRLKHGTEERVMRFEFISNGEISYNEFYTWRKVCQSAGVDMPTLETVNRKVQEIKEARLYKVNDKDLNHIIEEKNSFRKHPINYAMTKILLSRQRETALLRGDGEVAAELSAQIRKIDKRADELDKRRTSSISFISSINQRNRSKNVVVAEKAIMEEVRAPKKQRVDDAFTRRQTKPTMLFRAKEPYEELTPTMIPILAPVGRKHNEDETKIIVSSDNDLYSLNDFELDLDDASPPGM